MLIKISLYSPTADSHHKLVRWRMISHGGIDGYIRLIIFLQCSSNNQASTMLRLFFLSAVHKYKDPSRVRSDQGLENVAVGRYMIETRGSERNILVRAFIINGLNVYGGTCINV